MTERPTVALVVDVPDWAWAHHARALREYLADRFEIRIVVETRVGDQWRLPLAAAGADLTVYFWRSILRRFGTPEFADEVRQQLGDWQEYQRKYLGSRTATLICDHLFLAEPSVDDFREVLGGVTGYATVSRRLYEIYQELPEYPAPWGVLAHGVDLRRFQPSLGGVHAPLRVGWVGNSLWNAQLDDPKGLHTILKPALRDLQQDGVDIVGHFQDRVQSFRPFAEMPQYYQEIDVFVCASRAEGTPNPVLEAMAAGLPMVCTDVGVIGDVVGPLQRRFVLSERSVPALREALRTLATEPGLRRDLGQENLARIAAWDWSKRAPRWGDFFDHCLAVG